MVIKSSEVIKLKLEGLSFAQISRALNIRIGTAYRLYKRGLSDPNYSERVGNKPRRNSRPFYPLWQYNQEWVEVLYVRLPCFLSKYFSPNSQDFLNFYDYFLNFAYTSPQILKKSNPVAYFWGCVRKRVCGVFVNDIKNFSRAGGENPLKLQRLHGTRRL